MKILILILFPLISFGQIQVDSATRYAYYPEKDGKVLVGKHGQEGALFAVIGATFLVVGVPCVFLGDYYRNDAVEKYGAVMCVSSVPFGVLWATRNHKAWINQSYLEKKYGRP